MPRGAKRAIPPNGMALRFYNVILPLVPEGALIELTLMKRPIIFKLVAFLVPLAHGVVLAAPQADKLLQATEKADKTLRYSGTAVVARPGVPSKTLQIWHDGEKRRLEWTAPPVSRGDLLVDDGNSVWHYFSSENNAVQTRGAAEIDWHRLAQSMTAKVEGSGKVAGRDAWIVALKPRDKNQSPLKVWIDQKVFARLRVERGSGAAKSTMAMQKINFGAVPPRLFQWSPPAGAQITRTSGTLYNDFLQAQRGASWLSAPNSLPSGYDFESAVVDASGNGGKGEAWLRYANGLSRFSIFQQHTGDGVVFKLQKTKTGGWFVQKGGSRFIVLGLPDAPAQRVANSLK